MADLLLAGVLGAVVLAVVLLTRTVQRNRQLIQQLRAEVAAQQIAAMTQQPGPRHAAPPDPARRKGHLSLYAGGGVVAAVASFGGRLRDMWRAHRAVTVVVSSVAAAGTAAAITMTGGTGGAPVDKPVRTPGRMAPAPPAEPPAEPVADEELAREHPVVLEPRKDPEEQDVRPLIAGEEEAPPATRPPAPMAKPSAPAVTPPPAVSPPAAPATPSATPSAPTTRGTGRCLDLRPLVGLCVLKEKTPAAR